MAGKNQVTLDFAGDSSKLTSEFAKVGAAAKSMGDDVGRSSKKVGESTDGFDKLGGGLDNTYDKADALEAVGRGTADTMSGLGEIMKGNVLQGSTDLAGGVAALADGFAGALIPAMKSGIKWIKNTTVAQKALNLTMRLNPIGLIITAIVLLVGALILAYKRSETFRRIVNGAMRGVLSVAKAVGGFFKNTLWPWMRDVWSGIQRVIGGVVSWVRRNWPLLLGVITGPIGLAVAVIARNWGSIKRGATAVKDWIGIQFNALVQFVTGLPGRISRVTAGMFNGIKSAFRSAINFVINKWNNLSFSIPGVDTHIPGVGTVGGFTLSTPNIPTFHKGGVMPGSPGSEGLALLQAGERITPAGQSGAQGAGPESVEVRVFIGDRELTDIVRVETTKRDRRVKRAVTSGALRGSY